MIKRDESGMLTIEATLVLTFYLFMFLMIFDIVNLCRAQMKVSVAINNVAKEISQYSYLYGLTGLNDSMKTVHNRSASEKQDYSDIVSDVGTIYSSISGLGNKAASINPDNIISIKNDLAGVKDTASGLKDKISSKIKNPKETMLGLCNILVSTADEKIKSVIAEALAKAIVKQNLKTSSSMSDNSLEDNLRRLGFKKTGDTYFDSIDFSESKLFPGGTNKIEIVASYELKVVPFIKIDTSFRITQKAVTRGWLKGDKDS